MRKAQVFVVRVFYHDSGGVSGVVEHVESGRSTTFNGADEIGRLISSNASDGSTKPELPPPTDS